jgi:hypothetical protein
MAALVPSSLTVFFPAQQITFMCNVFTTWKNDQEVIFREARTAHAHTGGHHRTHHHLSRARVQVYDEQNRFMLSQTARPKADAAIQADAVDTHETSLLYPAYPPTGSLHYLPRFPPLLAQPQLLPDVCACCFVCVRARGVRSDRGAANAGADHPALV